MSPLVIILGIVAFMVFAGAGAALVLGGGRGDVEKRLDQFVSTTPIEIEEEVVTQSGPDVADRLDQVISGRDFVKPIRDRISKADVKLRVVEYMVLVVLSGAGIAFLTYLLMNRNIALAIVGLFLGLRLPRMLLGMAADRRMKAFDAQLGDTLNLWVNALRSGYSVLQGMETIATELPPPVSKEFERVVQEVRLGLSLNQAMENMYNRVPSEDLDLVITAVNIQREVGGNLAEVLDTISFTIRERVRIKGEIRTLTAQGRASGWIITLLPVALGGLLYMINPGYVSELWVSEAPWIWPNVVPCGWLVLAFSVMMIGAGAFAIRKIVDIEV
ncbi:MAG: type II secretion system F family protein [Chloroflexota bacterium]